MNRVQISERMLACPSVNSDTTRSTNWKAPHHKFRYFNLDRHFFFEYKTALTLDAFIPDVSIKANKWTRWNHSTFSYTYLWTIFMALCQAMLRLVNIYSLTIYVFINMVAGINPVTDNYDSAYRMTTGMRMRKQGKISFQFLENTQRFFGKKKESHGS